MPEWMEALLEHEGESGNAANLLEGAPPASSDMLSEDDRQFVPTDEELRYALDAIPARLIDEYDPGSDKPGCWWEVGAALRTLGELRQEKDYYFSIWKEWSRRAPKFRRVYRN